MVARPHSSEQSSGVLSRGSGVFTTSIKNAGLPFSPITVSSGEVLGDKVDFSLSKGNAIYVGSTVQPKALNVLACIRF